jgi:four helix bundle protein
MQDPHNLRVMGRAREMAIEVYRATSRLPSAERYGLSSQMRRAAISVGSNIAEGCGRVGNRQLVQFLQIALGSASELAFQAQIAVELELLSANDAAKLIDHIGAVKGMLARLIASHRKRANGKT